MVHDIHVELDRVCYTVYVFTVYTSFKSIIVETIPHQRNFNKVQVKCLLFITIDFELVSTG